MPVYEYTALDIKGKTTAGIIDAESSLAARQKLRASKTFPVTIKEVSDTFASEKSKKSSLPFFFGRIRPSEVAIMTRQLATLVDAGFPLVSAIDALIPQTGSQLLKKILTRIKNSIMEGNSFAEALSSYPGTFSSLYLNMVRAGETSGTLEIVLERLADITEKQQALKNRIQSALYYPIFMLFIGAIVLFLLLTFIIPNITSIFTDMNQTLPAPTLFLIAVSSFFTSCWWLVLLVIVGMVFAMHGLKKTEKGRRFWDKTMLFWPGICILITKLAVARFARTLGSLLENGVSMLTALEIVKNIVGNVVLADAIAEAANEVRKGQGLGVSLAVAEVFPNLSIQMIQVGEQSGELESMLNKIANIYENEVESSIMSMTSLLEPVMILIMGVIVGFIVLAICLPIFEMSRLVR
ncbi:MAG: type II secretion system protein GspF [Deltaproteobacteria bacterium CG1_02_45_11]|nr:MAG: type II secretion system protein GspF [Deltaproteobacteria bacterium CG1_02_45_11]